MSPVPALVHMAANLDARTPPDPQSYGLAPTHNYSDFWAQAVEVSLDSFVQGSAGITPAKSRKRGKVPVTQNQAGNGAGQSWWPCLNPELHRAHPGLAALHQLQTDIKMNKILPLPFKDS